MLLACVEPGSEEADRVESLATAGEWAVGYAEEELTYADPTGADRTLRVARWYPTSDDGGTQADYLLAGEGVWAGASPAAGGFPFAVFSHGHQAYAEVSSFLMAHLASHGFVVAAPDHTGNTTFDGSDRDDAIYMQRPTDISAVLDALGAAEALGIGHSFGGYTMLALAGAAYDPDCAPCQSYPDEFAAGFHEPRLSGVVAMAPGDFDLFGSDGLAEATAPIFHMTATEDAPGDDIWSAIAGNDNLHLSLVGGGHNSFTDYADVIEDVPLDREEGFRIVDVYTLAWAIGEDAILDGTLEVSEDAELGR